MLVSNDLLHEQVTTRGVSRSAMREVREKRIVQGDEREMRLKEYRAEERSFEGDRAASVRE